MDVRRSRLPKNPVNIGRTAQKSAKQGEGPAARGTQSTKEGNSNRDKVKTCPQEWLRLHKPQADCVTPSCFIDSIVFLYSSALKFEYQTQSVLKLNSCSGLRPRPHARRGFSLRSSLLGASGFTQPTSVIMRHAKQSAPERPFEVSIFFVSLRGKVLL